MVTTQRITPCLWFADEAEAAAQFYTAIFKNSRITKTSRSAGSVMVVAFELDGHAFTALNGGPVFKFNEAISLQVSCETQDEIDYYWTKLGDGGDPKAQQCGWLKDRYGLSWQVVPRNMGEIFGGGDAAGAARAMEAMRRMKKIDIAALERARDAGT